MERGADDQFEQGSQKLSVAAGGWSAPVRPIRHSTPCELHGHARVSFASQSIQRGSEFALQQDGHIPIRRRDRDARIVAIIELRWNEVQVVERFARPLARHDPLLERYLSCCVVSEPIFSFRSLDSDAPRKIEGALNRARSNQLSLVFRNEETLK